MAFSSATELLSRAEQLTRAYGRAWDQRLGRIMILWVGPPPEFPVRRKKKVVAVSEVDDEYLLHYIKRYYKERERAIVMQPVRTRPDPVVNEVLKAFQGVAPENLEQISKAHRLSMQAENIIGKLLERYIATLLEPKGWVWCAGETVRSVDFMRNEGTSDLKLLQIKNRSNSENSASKSVRAGTKIEKWFRINSTTGETRWQLLPENEQHTCTEEGFRGFLRTEAMKQRPIVEVPMQEAVAAEILADHEQRDMFD